MAQRRGAAAAVAEAGGGIAQVEATGEELASGVVSSSPDVELHPGRVGSLRDLVRRPVRFHGRERAGSLENRYASSRSPTPTAASSDRISSR